MALQEDLNQRVADLTVKIAAEHQQVADAVEALEAEVQALKDQVANGTTLDFTGLDAAVASVGGIFEPSTPPTA